MGYDIMKLRMSPDNGIRSALVNDSRFLLKQEFENCASYADSFALCDGIAPSRYIKIRFKKEKYSSSNGFTRNFITQMSDKIVVGDLLYDCENNNYWICKSSSDNGGLYRFGVLIRCGAMPLRWQDNSGNILEYPIFDYSQFTSDETDFRIINVGDGKHRLVTVADKNTIELTHDKRVFWSRSRENPTVYTISQNDSTTMFYDKGLVKITLSEDQYNSDKDNLELRICDYKKPFKENHDIKFDGDNRIRIGRSRRLWVASESCVKWLVEPSESVLTEIDGNNILLKIKSDVKLVGTKIIVAAEFENGEKSECEFEIIGGV